MKHGQFIYIAGCDGTGKSTQAELLMQRLSVQGVKAQHVWMRFPFFFSLPLLAYARWKRYSWHEERDGMHHGYWDFRRSWLLRRAFPWIFLLDAAIVALLRIYLPIWRGENVVCERFVLDMLADLIVACDDPALLNKPPGAWFIKLIPHRANTVILELDAETIRTRRPDLKTDCKLEARLQAFRRIARNGAYPLISSALPVEVVQGRIWERILQPNETA
jgi:thymidylate kinase